MIYLDEILFRRKIDDEGLNALVEFWAPWCPFNRLLKPKIEAAALRYGDGLLIGRVDIDREGELARSIGVEYVPGLVLFAQGRLQRIWYGDLLARDLLDELSRHLAPIPEATP